jgi:hypothetical protein
MIFVDAARHGPTAGMKPRSRIESDVPADRLSDLSLFPRRAAPRRKQSGRGRDSINRHVGPDEQRCSAKMDCDRSRFAIHLATRLASRVHPRSGANLRRAQPQERRRDGTREEPDRRGQAAEPGESRVRNAACEKRPRRMTRPRTGRREPAPADVVGRSVHVVATALITRVPKVEDEGTSNRSAASRNGREIRRES